LQTFKCPSWSASSPETGQTVGLDIGRTCTCLAIKSLVELVDRWGNLQPGLQDGLLPLEADVLGPLDEAGEIALGLDVLADAEVASALLKEGVDNPLDLGFLDGQRGCCHLLSLLLALYTRWATYYLLLANWSSNSSQSATLSY
jgi:hypothetical protein